MVKNKEAVLGTLEKKKINFWFRRTAVRDITCLSCVLQNVVSKSALQFKGNSQHDAQEFLLWLLDRVHEDLNHIAHPDIRPPRKVHGYSQTLDSHSSTPIEWCPTIVTFYALRSQLFFFGLENVPLQRSIISELADTYVS